MVGNGINYILNEDNILKIKNYLEERNVYMQIIIIQFHNIE